MINIDKQIKYWKNNAITDINTAEILINNKRIYVVECKLCRRVSITIPDEIGERIKKYSGEVFQINVSKICAKAIKKELDKLEK